MTTYSRFTFSVVFTACFAVSLSFGQTWARSIHVVDGPNAGTHTSFTLISGRPAISYHDAANGDLRYAEHDGSTWQYTTVDSAGIVGLHTSLAELPSGEPAISYFDRTNFDLKYAWREAGVWHVETVDAGEEYGSAGRFSNLVILPSGYPAICYADNHRLKYAWYDGSMWQFEIIDSNVADMSMALQPDGNPAIAYLDIANMDARYAWFDGVEWHTEFVYGGIGETNQPTDAGAWIALTFPAGGTPAICYHEYVDYNNDKGMDYSWFEDGAWQVRRFSVYGDPYGGYHTSATTLPSGQLAIAYARDPNESRLYIQQPDLTWKKFTVEAAGGEKTWLSLGHTAGGIPAMSYFDEGDRVLKFAMLVNTGDMNCDGTVDLFDVDPFGTALTDPAAYAAAHPLCSPDVGDCNKDGVFDLFDIDPFVELLSK